MSQYAIDYCSDEDGKWAPMPAADRIQFGLLTEEMQARSKARCLSERDYMIGNLLGREVRVEDVADASRRRAGAHDPPARH